MDLYSYDGPVLEFEKCIADHWRSQTVAPSEKKARSNLVYQFKKQSGKCAGAKIMLPGKLKKEEIH